MLYWHSEVQQRIGHNLGSRHLSWFEGAAPLWPQSQIASYYLATNQDAKAFNSFLLCSASYRVIM